jgi:hypothetical protein
VPVAALDRIIGSTIALLEFVVGQMGCEVDASWHAPVLQLHAATPYDFYGRYGDRPRGDFPVGTSPRHAGRCNPPASPHHSRLVPFWLTALSQATTMAELP